MVLPCLMGVFNTIVGRCFGWISTEAAHLISYGHNIDNLSKQVLDLTDAIISVESRIGEAENNRGATRVDAVVDRLLERMASLIEEASKIIADDERSSDCTCIIRLQPNLWACYLTSKSAKEAINEAVELLEKEKKLDRVVSYVDYSNCLGVTPNSDFEELQSRVLVSYQIVEALKDPNVHKVGVYGMGGTGKTTLAIKIGAELQLNGTFNYVVLATVSEKQSLLQNNYQSNLISIQEQIAGGLKIQLQDKALNDRATQLREQLQKRDKLLIIFDDIWSKFELETVGIPIGSNFMSHIKILMTSRSKMVLENEMDATKTFPLDSLPTDDARNLFDKMVGGDAHYCNWPLIAHQVVDLCGGILILLVTTGRALRNANQSIWEDALIQLKQFDGEHFDEEAYKKIEVSYNFLKNEEIKKLFLLCAQLDHRCLRFEDLLKYSMGLDLFKGRKKIKEVSGRLHKYLRDLKGCCLLQDGNEEGIIKMHDVIHKFASFLAIRDHGVFSVANNGELEEWPSMEQFAHFSAISFYYCCLPSDHELPVAFDNSKIESFLMLRRETDASFQIPDNLFVGMKGIKLMNLTRMSLSPVLVSSLSVLIKLRTLCLDFCELSDISVIGELPMLQALSLVGSSITLLPKEIGKLGSTLKLLDLRYCWKLERIAAGVIFKLTLLEDLRIGESYTHWERLEGGDKSSNIFDDTKEATVASLEELKNLQNLISLEIHICEHANMFPKDLVFKKLETFRICFGNWEWSIHGYTLPRTLEFKKSTVVDIDGEGIKALMTRVDSLSLVEIMGPVNLSEMDSKGFPELKYLKISDGNEIQYIVKKNYKNCVFPKLETLKLEYLSMLERICDDHVHPLPVGSFQHLRAIEVFGCESLSDLLSSKLAKDLLRLEEIKVSHCESMESIIISKENEEEIQIGFTHQLRVLHLDGLPRVVSFCSFKQIEGGLPSPITLFNKKIALSKLEVLNLRYMKIEKIWDDHLTITAEETCWFQNLTRLDVSCCDNLSYLFTSSMVKSLAKLKYLDVRYCESIEEIVATREGEMEGERLLLFPKLESIEFYGLPNLKRFCDANLLECQSLQTLKIKECPLLKTFNGKNESSLFDEKIIFPKLEELELKIMKIEKIWDDHLAITVEETTLQNLKSFEVSSCHNLSYLFTISMVRSLAKLEILEVRYCESIEEIVLGRKGEMKEEKRLLFPKLRDLEVRELPKLKRFCHANLLECQSLQKLKIMECPLLNAFMGANESSLFDEKTLARIGELELIKLSNMKEIWSEHSPLKYHMVPEVLEVTECGSLIRLAPPSTPMFQNLTGLYVSECPMLIKLLASSSTAKTLVNLEMMAVSHCSSLEEIVGIDDQWDDLASNNECIVLDKLKSLYLDDLNSLTSFCSTFDCNFRFPSLYVVIVINCPKMKFFSKGALTTPKLIKVQVDVEDEDEKKWRWRWEGDLNSTIRQLFEEKEVENEDDDGDEQGGENEEEEVSNGETEEEKDE